MKHTKRNHAMISAAVLTVVATATVACSSSSDTAATTSTVGKGGPNSLTDGSRVTSLLQSGLTQADKEKWSAAATSFQNVLAINPGNVYANYDLGVIAQNTGNSSEAISYYHKAIAANAAYTPAMYNEAILLESSQPQQAIAVYRKIVSIDPRASTAYLRMAMVQAEQGDITDAKANHAKAVSIDPALSKYKLPAKN
jgi:tetratricopeptide (TPR) repeat protein